MIICVVSNLVFIMSFCCVLYFTLFHFIYFRLIFARPKVQWQPNSSLFSRLIFVFFAGLIWPSNLAQWQPKPSSNLA